MRIHPRTLPGVTLSTSATCRQPIQMPRARERRGTLRRYQTHRGIDGAYGVITATVVGPGDENEAHRMTELLQDHQAHTQRSAQVVVADSKYGTTANFLDCYDRGILAHIPVLKQTQDKQERRSKIFPESMFVYDRNRHLYMSCRATA